MSQILSHPANVNQPGADRRPDPHAGRHAAARAAPPVVIDPIRGQVLDVSDASEAPAAPDTLTLGMLGSGSPFIPDVELDRDPFTEQLNDDGRNEVAGYDSLAAMVQRRCPGIMLSLTVLWRRSYAADGSIVPGRRQSINVAGTDGKGWADSVSGEDPEEVFGSIAGKWLARRQAGVLT